MSSNNTIELKLIINGKEAITTLNLTDENLRKLVTGFERVRVASQKSSLDIAAAWGSVTMGINQAMQIAERFYGIISAPIKVAGQFEAYETQLKVMLGSATAAKARLEELQEFAATTPFTLPQVVEAGNQLQAMNRYSIETIRQLGDLAAASGKPFDQVMNAYAKLVSGQKGIAIDMFRDLLITSKDWAKATGAHFSKSGEIMTSAEAMAEALPKILKEKGFDGMMAEQSKIMNGMTSNFDDAVTKLFSVVGNKLLPAAKNTIQSLTESVNELSVAIEGVSEKNTHVIEDEAIMNAQKARVEFDLLSTKYLALVQATKNTKSEKESFSKVISELNSKYPDLIKYIDLTKSSYENAVVAFAEYKNNLIKNLDVEVKVASVRDRLREKTEKEVSITNKKVENEQLQFALAGEKVITTYNEQTKRLEVIKQKADYIVDPDMANKRIKQNNEQITDLTGEITRLDKEITDLLANDKIKEMFDRFNKPKEPYNRQPESKKEKSGVNVEIFDAQKLSEIEKRLRDEKIKAIQQAEDNAIAIIISSLDHQLTLARNNAKASITDKQQLEAVLADIDLEGLDMKKQLLEEQLSEIKANTTLEKDERELKAQELLTAITTIEGQILDVKKQASDKSIGFAEQEAKIRRMLNQQLLGDSFSLFGQLYSREQESTRREVDNERKKRSAKLESERKARLEHAVTKQEEARINEEFDKKQEQLDAEMRAKQKEAGLEMFNIQKGLNIAKTMMETYLAATAALTPPPTGLGPVAGIPYAAVITALGISNAALIATQQPPGYARGGFITGLGGPYDDANLIRASNGEYVVNADATSRHINILDAINNNRELKIPVYADRNSELTTEIRLLRQENRRLLSQQLKAFSRPHKIKAGIDRYETAAIVETAETLINRSKA